MLDRFQDFRRAKGRHALSKALGITAAALGGGAYRPADPMQADMQKAQLKNQVLQEMHETGRAQTRASGAYEREALRQMESNWRKKMDMATAQMRQVAQNDRSARGRQFRLMMMKRDELTQMADPFAAKLDPQVRGALDGQLTDPASALLAEVRAHPEGGNPRTTQQALRKARELGLPSAAMAVEEWVNTLQESNLPPDQKLAAIRYLQEQTGYTAADLPALGAATEALEPQAAMSHQAAQVALNALDQQILQTIGGPGHAQLAAEGAQVARMRQQVDQAEQAPQTGGGLSQEVLATPDEDLVERLDVRTPEGSVIDGAAYTPAETHMAEMGVDMTGTPTQRSLQLLDQIEKFSSDPKYVQMRNQIMESPEFKEFKKTRGYQDDEFAFKEMNRETRYQTDQRRIQDRKIRAQNLRAGLIPGRGKGKEVKMVTPPVYAQTKTIVDD